MRVNRHLYKILHDRYLELRYNRELSNLSRAFIWRRLKKYKDHGKFVKKLGIYWDYSISPAPWEHLMLLDLSYLTSLTHLCICENNSWRDIEYIRVGSLPQLLTDIHNLFDKIPTLRVLDYRYRTYPLITQYGLTMTRYDVIILHSSNQVQSATYTEKDGELFCNHVKTNNK